MRHWLPWVLWCLTLVASPVTIAVLGTVYERDTPAFDLPRPWATRAVDAVCLTHLAVSVIASIHVFWLARGGYRWLAWGVVLLLLAFTWFVGFGAVMATTGIYL